MFNSLTVEVNQAERDAIEQVLRRLDADLADGAGPKAAAGNRAWSPTAWRDGLPPRRSLVTMNVRISARSEAGGRRFPSRSRGRLCSSLEFSTT